MLPLALTLTLLSEYRYDFYARPQDSRPNLANEADEIHNNKIFIHSFMHSINNLHVRHSLKLHLQLKLWRIDMASLYIA